MASGGMSVTTPIYTKSGFEAERGRLIHCALVYLAASRAFTARGPVGRPMAFTLLLWAGNCRRRVLALKVAPSQLDLFD